MVTSVIKELAARLREDASDDDDDRALPDQSTKEASTLRTIMDANREDDRYRVMDVWEHESGLPCITVQNQVGAYTGYVGTNIDYPVDYESGMEWDKDNEPLVHVHGGVTWGPDEEGWVGFDTAHANDIPLDEDGYVVASALSMSHLPMDFRKALDTYENGESTEYHPEDLTGPGSLTGNNFTFWTPEKVKEETNELAAQLAAVSMPRYRIRIRNVRSGNADVSLEDKWDRFLRGDENG